MLDLASAEFFAWNPFRMLHVRSAAPEECRTDTPMQAQQLAIVSRTSGVLHTFTAAENFRVPSTDMGIAALLSALQSPNFPHEPRRREQQRRRRPVAA